MSSDTITFAAIAVVLTLGVLAIALRPLWRDTPAIAIAIAAMLALGTFGLYLLVGTPAALDPRATQEGPGSMEDAIAGLEARLRHDPGQLEGWLLLGRSYAVQDQPALARDAFARAAALAPDDPDVLVEAAESRALATPQRLFDPEAVAQLQRALRLQPAHQRARWFLGIAQRQAGYPAGAVDTWEPLLSQLDAGTAATLRSEIDAARADAGLPPLPVAATPSPAATTQGVRVRVAIDPDLVARMRIEGDASVFVIARIPGGTPMPVAVERRLLRELPVEVVLDDSDNLMSAASMSSLKEVELLARLSMSGDAAQREGDIESQPVRVSLPSKAPIDLVIGDAP
jgi:cytochrome c-type biogenesis protein CcmH